MTMNDMTRGGTRPGSYETDVRQALEKLVSQDIIRRIWQRDHTVWKPEPDEIANRLGWLTVAGEMRGHTRELRSFATEIKDRGFKHVVLLGMGGSSLGAKVINGVFGSAPGYPKLIVLDSTVPAVIQEATDGIIPQRTLFIVSSLSGSTIETDLLYKYFRKLVEQTKGENSGENFIAVTAAGSPLAKLAGEENFRRVFISNSDIGGRYSVLSNFGLLPAALIGTDIEGLLDRAESMKGACAASVPAPQNPGARLGAYTAGPAQGGRDKLTIIASPSVESFGCWAEQLIAESTGKEGKGIVPIDGEPVLPPSSYGNDRLFVYLRMKGDDNRQTDTAVKDFQEAGQPVAILEMRDKFDLGAEFFRWEFAVACAGALLGINPFNQPNVQSAKDETKKLLRSYIESGTFPDNKSIPVENLLAGAGPGSYFAILAFINQTEESDAVFKDIRKKVMERYRIATTADYGPRYLHSTGQLHKGGTNNGLFLMITAGWEEDISIPGERYSFGVVADAQSAGDYQALRAGNRKAVNIRLSQVTAENLKAIGKRLKPAE
jgi:glucose-6-phosphate isomerase